MTRRIIHVDMDAFYASVEQRDRPELRGRPVAVGGSPESRGVVAAASYEARTFGVRSAIPMSRAIRLCPHLSIVRPDFAKYRAASQQVFAIFREVTPLVEGLSLDEAYLDVTENAWSEPLGMSVARRIKARIREVTGLSASAGVAPNKFLAKIASAWRKPDGLTVIAPERVESFLQKLEVDALWGVGPVTEKRLRERGIHKLTDVRTADPELLRSAVGSMADWLLKLAAGEDDRAVEPNRPAKSSSSECTYAQDLTDLDRIRYNDFTTITRSQSQPATDDADEIARCAVALLDKTEVATRPVRLLGAGVHNFVTPEDHAASWPLLFQDFEVS
jgi:DNA polymerase-4